MHHFNALFLSLLVLFVPYAGHGKILLASGAGYRAIVDDLADRFEEESTIQVERIYGNMARVTAQARVAGTVDLVVGDAAFLKNAKLPFSMTRDVGKGRLVAIFAKDNPITSAADMENPWITRIAMPDSTKAIYGKAAMEYLENMGLYRKLAPKILTVATVPQAASYVISGDVDVALINMIHANQIKDKIGGYIQLDEQAYSPISIVIGVMEGSSATEECREFLRFLQTGKARKIISAHGM